jgi:hypothetical protein
MCDSSDRPDPWAIGAVAALPSPQTERLERPRNFNEIDELIVAHAGLDLPGFSGHLV